MTVWTAAKMPFLEKLLLPFDIDLWHITDQRNDWLIEALQDQDSASAQQLTRVTPKRDLGGI